MHEAIYELCKATSADYKELVNFLNPPFVVYELFLLTFSLLENKTITNWDVVKEGLKQPAMFKDRLEHFDKDNVPKLGMMVLKTFCTRLETDFT